VSAEIIQAGVPFLDIAKSIKVERRKVTTSLLFSVVKQVSFTSKIKQQATVHRSVNTLEINIS
jgi:hypothetical protein